MASKLKGIKDSSGSGNIAYVDGRGSVKPREQAVKEVKRGLHPNFHVIKVGDTEYVRGNPDKKTGNNIND